GDDGRRDSTRMIQTTYFDGTDGAPGWPIAGAVRPIAAKASDGRIWFRGADGVNIVDPRRFPFNRLPPPVRIEQITVDHKTRDAADGLPPPPPLVRDLQIDFTALSLIAPEKNRFRYKLEGYDAEWQDAGTRRQAFYTNLRPRSYRFRVIASNNSGVWNETGA